MALHPRQTWYVVQHGDTLWAIAEHAYGDPLLWSKIAAANRIPDGNLILIGMKLKLPPIALLNTDRYLQRPGYAPAIPVKAQRCSISNPNAATDTGLASPATAQTTGIRGNASGKSAKPSPLTFPRARPVQYPALKYEFDGRQFITQSTPYGDLTIRMNGELTAQFSRTFSTLSFSKSGEISAEIKSEYESELTKLTDQIKISWDDKGQPELSFGFSVGSKINGGVFMTQSFEIKPPNRFVYTLSPHEISGTIDDMDFSGNIGFEIELAARTPPPPTGSVPVAVPSYQYAPRSTSDPIPWGDLKIPVWVKITAIVVVAAIVVAEPIKDVFTGGAGLAETPLSYAAAYAVLLSAGFFDEAAAETPAQEKR